MAKGKEDGAVDIAVKLDKHAVEWLDHIARGALTTRSTVCAVLFAIHVDTVMGERGAPIAQALAPAVEGHVTTKRADGGLDTDKEWLTVEEAARALRVNRNTITRRLTDGTFKRHKVGRSTYVAKSEIDAARTWLKPRVRRVKEKRALKKTAPRPAKKATKRKAK